MYVVTFQQYLLPLPSFPLFPLHWQKVIHSRKDPFKSSCKQGLSISTINTFFLAKVTLECS